MVGFLEEEAVISYNGFLREIDNGHIANTPASQIAIEYYNLVPTATLRDVVLAVRADEANHRDVNHFLADKMMSGDENLRTSFSRNPYPVASITEILEPAKISQ